MTRRSRFVTSRSSRTPLDLVSSQFEPLPELLPHSKKDPSSRASSRLDLRSSSGCDATPSQRDPCPRACAVHKPNSQAATNVPIAGARQKRSTVVRWPRRDSKQAAVRSCARFGNAGPGSLLRQLTSRPDESALIVGEGSVVAAMASCGYDRRCELAVRAARPALSDSFPAYAACRYCRKPQPFLSLSPVLLVIWRTESL